jgi:hypothetical protein
MDNQYIFVSNLLFEINLSGAEKRYIKKIAKKIVHHSIDKASEHITDTTQKKLLHRKAKKEIDKEVNKKFGKKREE